MIISSLLISEAGPSSLIVQVEFLILLLIVTLIVALLSRGLRIPYTLLLVIVGFVVGILSFILLGFELALTHIVQSFLGIFLGLIGAVIGRLLMIYIFIPLQDVLARWWIRRTPEWHSRFPRPRPVPSAWRPMMMLSGLRGALALVLSLPTALEQQDLLTDIVYGVILVTLLGQGLTLRVLLPRWKEKLVRAEGEEPLPTQA